MKSISIDRNRLSISGDLFVEASEIDLAPGEWPDVIFLRSANGATTMFDRGRADYSGEDLAGVYYHSRDGQETLIVAND